MTNPDIDVKALVEKLTREDRPPFYDQGMGAFIRYPRNPDGPDAAQALIALQQERDHWLREAQRLLKSGQEALDKMEALQERNAALVEHIRWQADHVENRIKDGIEMGASVWRIALEDVVAENRAALTKDTPDHGGER